jgi:prophage tail gpP-like protein
MMTPADAWHVRLAQPSIKLPPTVVEGAKIQVRMNHDTILMGILDERDLSGEKGKHELLLTGRDGAGLLLDCSSPVLSMRQITLDQVITSILAPLKFPASRIRIDAETKLLREKVNIEPGDSAWDSLRRAAEANGLWPWFEPDGTLVVGGPRYDMPPIATLVMREDGKGNNVLRLSEKRSMVERYSQVTVYGQSHANGIGASERDGRNNIKGVEKDTGVQAYRPKVVVDHEAINESIARARGRKIISDSRIKSYTITATVRGHRTDDGVLWSPGQRVAVKSELHNVDGVYFLMGRRFTGDKHQGQRTILTLKEDGVWLLDAHPSKRKHRRGKNSLPGQIVDLPLGASQ